MKRSTQSLVLRAAATLAAAGCASVLALTVPAAPVHLGAPTPAGSVSVRADGSAPVASPSPTPTSSAGVNPDEWNSKG
jgi:type IV pilus biogenesis protein CpaD/CtpE